MSPVSVAAVLYGPGDDVDAALAACVAAMAGEGAHVAGLLQRFGAEIRPGKHEMLLEVLPTGETIRLNDPRGAGVIGCILDADSLARAAMALRAGIRSRPDLLVVGRFGKEEAVGGGLRAELAEAILDGIPLLIGVRRSLLPDWEAFLGQPAVVLSPEPHATIAWARSVRPSFGAPAAVGAGASLAV